MEKTYMMEPFPEISKGLEPVDCFRKKLRER